MKIETDTGRIRKTGVRQMQKHMKNGNFYIGVAVLMMVLLFISSSQTYEQQSSVSFLSKWLKNEPFKASLSGISFSYAGSIISIETSGYIKFIEFFVRKGSHFFSYFIMGGSLFLGIYPKIKNTVLAFFLAWFSATGYAAMDEYHQMLTGGRSPLFEDVALDSSGALTACIIAVISFLWVSNKKK